MKMSLLSILFGVLLYSLAEPNMLGNRVCAETAEETLERAKHSREANKKVAKERIATEETASHYLMDRFAPTLVTGIVILICYWLGGRRERKNLEAKEANKMKGLKENIVLSLHEVQSCNKQNEHAFSQQKSEIKEGHVHFDKSLLFHYPLEFYEIAKAHSFSDFSYKLKSDFVLLKQHITLINYVISSYNDLGQQANGSVVQKMEHQEEEIKKIIKYIAEVCQEMLLNKSLVEITEEHFELSEEMEKKRQEIRFQSIFPIKIKEENS